MIRKLKGWVKKHKKLKRVTLWLMQILAPVFQIVNVLAIPRYITFLSEWRQFRKAGGVAKVLDFHPCLNDKSATTGIDTHYFHQAIWAFKQIMASGAKRHVDVGSDIRFVGMLTVIADVTFIDIRPLEIKLAGFTSKSGSIVSLPIEDRSVPSLSSMHVIEHIGLGRYGDPIDPRGSLKACNELKRVLTPDGRLYVSVPIGRSQVQFNGQRVFSVADVLAMFHGLNLVELSIVDTTGEFIEDVAVNDVTLKEGQGLDYGLGMFVFSAHRDHIRH